MEFGIYRFDRMEVAGSLGDLGTLLPLALGMIVINGLDATGLFFGIGAFYILAGLYYRVPIAVQPMKTIGAYAVATGAAATQVTGAGLLMALILGLLGATNLMRAVRRAIPTEVIRGVQAATGTLLAVQGLKFIFGKSSFQAAAGLAEPHLAVQTLLNLPVGLWLGLGFIILTLAFLDSKSAPAGLIVVVGGILAGLALGASELTPSLALGFHLPSLLPQGMPTMADFGIALLAMALPQTPMTLGNAVIANADLSNQYFPQGSDRVTPRALCLSMAIANLGAFLLGGMPMCHGAGGLAAHYRFGARTAGSNLIIGLLFLIVAILFGPSSLDLLHMLPLSVLGVLLFFAGTQLVLTILDMRERRQMFVIIAMLTLTLAMNLAWAFLVGMILAWLLKRERFNV